MKTPVDPNAVLPEVEQMLYNLSWKFAQTYPVPFEEAKSEAYYAFVRACADFDSERGSKFSSWCYYWVWTHLKTFVTKRTVDPLTFIEINEETLGETSMEPISFPGESRLERLSDETQEIIKDLSGDAKEILELLLETTDEIAEGVTAAKRLLTGVKDRLSSMGRDRQQTIAAVAEIQAAFIK